MERTKETLEARVRETPLVDRLKECRQRIGKMCSEGRPPRMCIPVQHDDDDFFISTTLSDAQATVEALQQDRDALKIGLNALRDAYDELESRHNDTTASLDALTPAECTNHFTDGGKIFPSRNCCSKGGDGE